MNQVSPERGSVLHLAAKSTYFQMCQILLLKNIDLSLKDGSGLLAKQVTSNTQIQTLIEKYEEEIKIHTEEVAYFEEIKEEEEDYENDDRNENESVRINRRQDTMMSRQ